MGATVSLNWPPLPNKLSDGSAPPAEDKLTGVTIFNMTSGTPVEVISMGLATGYQIHNVQPGTYTYVVVLTDSNGLASVGDPVVLTVPGGAGELPFAPPAVTGMVT